jgi:hypothetical protein
MGGQIVISTNESPLFDGRDYLSWRENMKRYMKSRGYGVWDSVVSKLWHLTTSKRKSKTAKEARRRNSVALKAIQDGLSDQVKENSYHMLELEIINFKKINESINADLMTQIEEAKKNEES